MNLMFWSGESEEEGRDAQVSAWLSSLDPGHTDAAYWVRFHRDAMRRSRSELARRRQDADLSVMGLMSSWSRAVVPAALAAAAAAGIFLVQPPAQAASSPLLVEEVLTMGLSEPIPVMTSSEEDETALILAAEIY